MFKAIIFQEKEIINKEEKKVSIEIINKEEIEVSKEINFLIGIKIEIEIKIWVPEGIFIK